MRFTDCKCGCHQQIRVHTGTSPEDLNSCPRCIGYHEGLPY